MPILSPMTSPLYFQIPILLSLIVAAYSDYKTRIVSNKIIIFIVVFSIPIILQQTSWLFPILLCLLFLGMFYFSDQIEKINPKLFANPIGGADTKVFIPLLLGMSTNEIFIFFFLFSVSNIILIFKFWRSIPLFISILFGYFGIVTLSFLPIVIRIVFGE